MGLTEVVLLVVGGIALAAILSWLIVASAARHVASSRHPARRAHHIRRRHGA